MKLPFWHKIKLIWMYGFDAFVAFKIYGKIHEHNYQIWKNTDWRTYLNTYCFNSNHPLAIAYRQHWPMFVPKDKSWKACKKHMNKATWKALSLKSIPEKRPSCLQFKYSHNYDSLNEVMPDRYANICNLCNMTASNCFIEQIGKSQSVEQLVISFDINQPLLAPIELGCVIFILWSVKSAYELNQLNNKLYNVCSNFYSYSCSINDYEKFLNALKMTSMFDKQLNSSELKKSISVFCKWYKNDRHSITGIFDALSDNNLGSYKKDDAYIEIMSDINGILKFKKETKYGLESKEEST